MRSHVPPARRRGLLTLVGGLAALLVATAGCADPARIMADSVRIMSMIRPVSGMAGR